MGIYHTQFWVINYIKQNDHTYEIYLTGITGQT